MWKWAATALIASVLAVSALILGAGVAPPLVSSTPTRGSSEVTRSLPMAVAPTSPIRTCSVAGLAADPLLGHMQARVQNVATGEVLFDRGGEVPARSASVQKVLTAAAALAVLGPDFRATTKVVRGSDPGSVVLVGGGDLTLSRTPRGTPTVYPGAAHLADLAAQVRAASAASGSPSLTTIVLDSSAFDGDEWQHSWDPAEREEGTTSLITALQVDGDRDVPTAEISHRSLDPVARAGDAFAAELGGSVTTVRGLASADAEVIGQVSSPTVAELVHKALSVSDNDAAEMLARLTAIQVGTGRSFEAIQPAVLTGLAQYGIDTSGITLVDGSGLSDDNALPPAYLTKLFRLIWDRDKNLGVLFDSLPVAGVSGSLSYRDRFRGENAVAAGSVFAKTGWIDTGYTLSGIVRAVDGSILSFAIYALGDVGDNAKHAIDTWTTGIFRCGNNLSNN